ncbi:MAG: hypothetical protein ACFFFT_05510 [Candidatus Thorarchaeota archaeon]
MDPKHSNIFWHQGVKIFKEEYYETEAGKVKIAHLENDVTKSLLNLFRHCSPKVLKEFLKLIQVRDHPDSFEFDFQVTDTNRYRQRKNRIMLSIIGSGCEMKSNPNYLVEKGQPDACIFNDNTAILIEVKTQSPLIYEQIQGYINLYLGSAIVEKSITWEEISEQLRNIEKDLPILDRFLVGQFLDFMELIGIAEFSGFKLNDFFMLGELGKIPNEDYIDFKRVFHKKVDKFMSLLYKEITNIIIFKPYYFKVPPINTRNPEVWSAFYFYDTEKEIHVNQYPNLNFNYFTNGINLSINAEVKSSVKIILDKVKKSPKLFEKLVQELDGFLFTLYYKFQFLPMDNFIWKAIPGYAINSENFSSEKILNDIYAFEKGWKALKRTFIFEMKSGVIWHPSGRLFTENEINFLKNNNQNPNFSIRIEKYYKPQQISNLKRNVIKFFMREIKKFKKIIEFLNTQ